MPALSPDFEGFQAAQDRLRDVLGGDVVFHVTVAPLYPSGTVADPETGKPFDPWATPTPSASGATVDVTKRVSIVSPTPFGRATAEAGSTPLGPMEENHRVLILGADDWPDVQAATAVSIFGERYNITESRRDGMRGVERYLFFAERA